MSAVFLEDLDDELIGVQSVNLHQAAPSTAAATYVARSAAMIAHHLKGEKSFSVTPYRFGAGTGQALALVWSDQRGAAVEFNFVVGGRSERLKPTNFPDLVVRDLTDALLLSRLIALAVNGVSIGKL